jgi:SNF2 family DNA or RNA helicase
VTRNTIEERILERAHQKGRMQSMVIGDQLSTATTSSDNNDNVLDLLLK